MTTFISTGRWARGACAVGAVLLFAGSAAHADKGGDHQTQQTPGSFLGVSGSSIEFLNIDGGLFCYTGTMGSLVTDGNKLYMLSNNHVLARESTANPDPANPDTAANDTTVNVGDPIIQPGLLDENGDDSSCSPAGTNYDPLIAGYLSGWVPLVFSPGVDNLVDAAIAEVADCGGESCFDPNGRILDIGGLSGNIVSADDPGIIGLAVQKSGRTTGLTTGVVAAVGVEINVGYNNGTATFVDQIVVSGDKGAFIKAGDSGSLAVTRPTGGSKPHAVGLLFAGSRNGIAIANPIGAVLDAFTVTMVACTLTDAECADTGVTDGGGGGPGNGGGPGGGGGGPNNGGGGGRPSTLGGLDIAAEARDRHRDSLMANPDVVGTGLSVDRNGAPVIQVYTKGAARSVDHPIPSLLDGVKVKVVVTGEFKAL